MAYLPNFTMTSQCFPILCLQIKIRRRFIFDFRLLIKCKKNVNLEPENFRFYRTNSVDIPGKRTTYLKQHCSRTLFGLPFAAVPVTKHQYTVGYSRVHKAKQHNALL